MSNQRYTPEFKDEAVRQVVDRGYGVAEVAERLGVSTNSLHKWVKSNWQLLSRPVRSNRCSTTVPSTQTP